MGDKEDGCTLALQGANAFQALLLKKEVAHGQHLVHQQHLWLHMHGHSKSQPQLHPAAVGAQRTVKKRLQFGKVHNVVKDCRHLAAAQAGDHAVHVDVLSPRQLGVKAGAQVDQRAEPPLHGDAPGVGPAHASHHPQQR